MKWSACAIHWNILRSEGPYERMNISGVTGLTADQKAALTALGATDSGGLYYDIDVPISIEEFENR